MDNANAKKEKLNIGYLLPDWRDPDVAFFRAQLLQNYNKRAFNLFCYVNSGNLEKFSWLQDGTSIWREIVGMSADFAVQVVQGDKIDILVDLSGHKATNCLPILARKPAALQVSFVGYFNTTGLKAVDYLFTDKYCDPIGQKTDYFREKLVRLPQSHFCYTAITKACGNKESAFKRNGYITFGSFDHFTKLGDEFLGLWNRILLAIPNARLVLKSRIFGSGYGCQETRFRLKRLGFPIERIELRSSKHGNMKDYPDIDIMLDTYPYQGGVGTCDALYMGIPVIVMTGNRHSARFGYSILKNSGLEECIAFNSEEYIDKAVKLASNPYKLLHLHKNLHDRMLKSPLMDVRRYVGNVERAYQEIWRNLTTERQLQQRKKEIIALLGTIAESLVYVHGRLASADPSKLVGQILLDIFTAFKNIQSALQGALYFEKYSGEFIFLIKRASELQKFYRCHQYGRLCEIINQEIMPQVGLLVKEFEDEKNEL